MEIPVTKQRGKCKRKRLLKKRLRERLKRKVRSAKYRMVEVEMVVPEYNVTNARETLTSGTMQAESFWKNYAVAQEWQKRHNITWWRSRCVALEHENKLLRDKVRFLAQRRGYRDTPQDRYQNYSDNKARKENYAKLDTSDDNLEFNVTEDMLNFFETSERHKREMRQKRGSGRDVHENSEEISFIGATERARMKKEEAKLLYGDAGSKILTMETTLQSMIERHEDTANPQYWPNIPLRP